MEVWLAMASGDSGMLTLILHVYIPESKTRAGETVSMLNVSVALRTSSRMVILETVLSSSISS